VFILQHYITSTGNDPSFVSQELKIPIIKDSLVKIVLSNSQCNEYDEIWEEMEKDFLMETYIDLHASDKYKKKPPVFKNNICKTVGAVGGLFLILKYTIFNMGF
jgi:hypothetical protein